MSADANPPKPLFVAFLDIKSAYDSVWRNGLWFKLWQCGVHGKLWAVLVSMFDEQFKVVCNASSGNSSPFMTAAGTAQGAVLSPQLFNLFIDDLISALRRAGCLGISFTGTDTAVSTIGLLYADDIAIAEDSAMKLQCALDVCTEWARKWLLEFNPSKSAVVIFYSGRSRTVLAEIASVTAVGFRLMDAPLSVLPAYKYLGVTLTSAPRKVWDGVLGDLVRTATTKQKILTMRLGPAPDPVIALNLWNVYVRPTVEFAAQMWAPMVSHAMFDRLEKVRGRYLAMLLAAPRASRTALS